MVPEVVILRLPLYVRALAQLLVAGHEVVSSHSLGNHLQITPAQIRKDLSYFGKFGKQGRGYNIRFLLKELRGILGLEREWRACLVGMGRLGRAIINYPGFAPQGFEIVAAFDDDTRKVGRVMGGFTVQAMSEVEETVEARKIDIAIVAVPAQHVQSVIEDMVASGVLGILNYAPVVPQIPRGIVMRNIDPVLSLQSMTFYLQQMKNI